MIEPTRLSAYIASRICHDLVSPVSSVTSALDFIDEPGGSEMREKAESLLKEGARNASVRLQFLRYAFGSLGLNDGAADIHEAKKLTEDFVSTHKPSIEWDIETGHVGFGHVRLMMNMVLIGIDCLPRGGVISLRMRTEPGGLTITAICKGVRAKLRTDTEMALGGEEPEEGWSARTVQPLFTRILADEYGGELTAKASDEQVIIMAQGLGEQAGQA